MFQPNAYCSIAQVSGEYDIHGRPKQRVTYERVGCGVVRLIGRREKTTVRADSSASRGAASEKITDARLLFPAHISITTGDRVELMGFALRVVSVHLRNNMSGNVDHLEVDLNLWA